MSLLLESADDMINAWQYMFCLYDLFFSDWFEGQNPGRYKRRRPRLQDFFFSCLQDGRLYHELLRSKALLHQENNRQLSWPSKLPDLNINEHLWNGLNRHMKGQPVALRNL